MTTRADSAARTVDRVLDVALERYRATPYDLLRLDDVAQGAGVTAQTVIRRFGGKSGLVLALVERELGRIAATRAAAQDATVPELVHDLVRHYERYGDLILKMYAEADRVDGLPELARRARRSHVTWCRDVFHQTLQSTPVPVRGRRTAQVVAVCDATTWRVLRRECRLPQRHVVDAVLELLTAALGSTPCR